MSTPENNAPKKGQPQKGQPKANPGEKNHPEKSAPAEKTAGPDPEEYKVGYGNPPLATRFGPGNKMGKGRKKGSKGLKTIVNKEFGKKVATKENGKPVKKTKTEAGITQLANKFANGDPKVTDKALGLLERYGPQDEPEGPPPEKLAKDFKCLKKWLAMQDVIHPDSEENHHDQA